MIARSGSRYVEIMSLTRERNGWLDLVSEGDVFPVYVIYQILVCLGHVWQFIFIFGRVWPCFYVIGTDRVWLRILAAGRLFRFKEL